MLYRDFATQEQLDAQYLTASQLADPAAFMRQRQADSDEALTLLREKDPLPSAPPAYVKTYKASEYAG